MGVDAVPEGGGVMLVENEFAPVSARSVAREVGPLESPVVRRPKWPLFMFAAIAVLGAFMLAAGCHREGYTLAFPVLWFASWPVLIVGWAGATAWIVRGIK